MPKPLGTDVPTSTSSTDLRVRGLQHSLEAELSVLKEIDARYDQERIKVENWTGSGDAKARLLEQLARRHRKDREPHVLQLADLHERIMAVTLYRTVH
jgi:hypothetical protein